VFRTKTGTDWRKRRGENRKKPVPLGVASPKQKEDKRRKKNWSERRTGCKAVRTFGDPNGRVSKKKKKKKAHIRQKDTHSNIKDAYNTKAAPEAAKKKKRGVMDIHTSKKKTGKENGGNYGENTPPGGSTCKKRWLQQKKKNPMKKQEKRRIPGGARGGGGNGLKPA